MFGLPCFAISANRLSSILFTWSLHARLLILARSYDTIESRRCRGCPRCEFLYHRVPLHLIFVVLSRSLVMVVFNGVDHGTDLTQVLHILILLLRLV